MTYLIAASTIAAPALTGEGRRSLAARAKHLRNVIVPELDVLRQEHDPTAEAEYRRASRKLSDLETLLADAGAVEDIPDDPSVVELGETVTIIFDDGSPERYLLVDPSEAALLGGERLSVDSPLGQALVGHRIGERVTVRAPAGDYQCTVLSAERLNSTRRRPTESVFDDPHPKEPFP